MGKAISSDLQPVGDLASLSDTALEDIVGGADAIIHLAGRAHVMRETEHDPASVYRRANVDLTARLAAIAARTGVGRFVLASTVKVNGERTVPGAPFQPGDVADPQDAYARSKHEAERALFEASEGTTMFPVALRVPLIYGRNAKGNFPKLVEAVVAGRRLPLASIRNQRSLLYLGNLVEALEAVTIAPALAGHVHFVADAEAVSTPDLVRSIAVAWKVKPRLFAFPPLLLRAGATLIGKGNAVARLTDSLEVDTSAFRATTRWTPRWSLDAALARCASQHRQAPMF